MPRTERSVSLYFSKTPNLEPPFQLDSASFSTGAIDFPYALFAPLHYTSGYAYPLIVWLHGDGGDERQLQRIMPMVSMQNFVAVSPQGLGTGEPKPDEREHYGWRQEAGAIASAEQRVFDAIELARQKFNIHPRRVFLAGFDAGGTMAFRVAMSHPDRFAGVLSLCGAFPSGGKPFGNLIAARRLGMFLATGRASAAYPSDKVCEDLRLLHTAGLSIVLREYPCGQELNAQMLADVNRWVMEQITPPPAVDVESNAEWSHEAD